MPPKMSECTQCGEKFSHMLIGRQTATICFPCRVREARERNIQENDIRARRVEGEFRRNNSIHIDISDNSSLVDDEIMQQLAEATDGRYKREVKTKKKMEVEKVICFIKPLRRLLF